MGLKAEIEKSMALFNNMMCAAMFCDLFRAVIVHVSLLFEGAFNHWNTIEIVAITLSTILLAVMTIIMVLWGSCGRWCKECDSDDFEKNSETTCHIFLDATMTLSIWFYFIADNLTGFYNTRTEDAEDYREASQIILLMGLVGFFVVPRLKEVVHQKYDKREEEKDKSGKNKVPDRMVFRKFVIQSIAMVVEMDAVYTIFTNLNVECSTAQKVMPWLLYVVLLIGLIPYLLYKILQTIDDMTSFGHPVKVLLTAIMFGFLFAFFILADNNQPLDCSGAVKCTIDAYSNSTVIPGPHCTSNSRLRLVLTGLSINFYSIPMFIIIYISIKNCRE